ncbi:hypothetical protein nbrc107696_28560 [Gordonia spumicola]|uniref:Uncharacterized protein n=1 Tax=Gordonia spumicola TaxID=589161 RepID=A0A7I9VBK6_9ACTN|nr:hypothetical protein [Gordonia spumicola]GEE02410.1 hypothetical protein nbrc107696_28560 [Gordonia spumicola]
MAAHEEFFVDEDGNPIDLSELGDDYEIVDEPFAEASGALDEAPEDEPEPEPVPTVTMALASAPATEAPAPVPTAVAVDGDHGIPVKFLLVAAVVAALILGGLAFGMNKLGQENSIADVKAKATEKTEAVKDKVEDKTHPPIDACDGKQLKDAMWGDSRGDKPKTQLRIVKTVPLPKGFADRVEDLGDAAAERVVLLQQSNRDLGVYASAPGPKDARGKSTTSWWKVRVATADGVRVIEDGEGTGEDADAATACKSGKGGIYAVVGEGVPTEAKGMREGQVVVSAAKPDGAEAETVWVVMGDTLAKTTLEYAPEDDESEDSTKTTTATETTAATTEKGR